ncbi:hypothetical protein DFH08DRAFT_907501 [Mycena albidolilacea]|uniref:Uncharacterized protein n=1 Tax=Mycena albidolilacea TaxID=1033008 RepID=A0AAD6YXJ3_9AGAR|nr:hypothetical protein DFH08DRAFT_907501 [Mycena albidolilacea]
MTHGTRRRVFGHFPPTCRPQYIVFSSRHNSPTALLAFRQPGACNDRAVDTDAPCETRLLSGPSYCPSRFRSRPRPPPRRGAYTHGDPIDLGQSQNTLGCGSGTPHRWIYRDEGCDLAACSPPPRVGRTSGFEEGERKEDMTGFCAADDERSAAGASREEIKAGRGGSMNATGIGARHGRARSLPPPRLDPAPPNRVHRYARRSLLALAPPSVPRFNLRRGVRLYGPRRAQEDGTAREPQAGVLALDAPDGGLVYRPPAPGAFLRVLQTSWLPYPPLHADPGHVLFSAVHCRLGLVCGPRQDFLEAQAQVYIELSRLSPPARSRTPCSRCSFRRRPPIPHAHGPES